MGAGQTRFWSASALRAVAWLGVASLGAAAWLAWPRRVRQVPPAAPPVLAIAIDASASAVRTRPSWRSSVREQLAREAERARARGERVVIVRAARDVERVFGPAPAGELAARLAGQDGLPFDPGLGGRAQADADGASPIARALELAREAVLRGGPGGRVVLIGDGTFTGRDPARALDALTRAGLGLERVALPARERSDLALTALDVPQRLEVDAPLALALELEWTPAADAGADARATVEVVLERGGRREPARSFPLALPRAPRQGEPTAWRARIELGPLAEGRVVVHARARLDSGDPLPENDALASIVRVGARRVVGWCAPEGERAALGRLLSGFASAGLELVPLAPAELAAELASLDAVITAGSGEELPHASLVEFVRRGGGWLAFDGPRLAYGADEPLPAILPLIPERGQLDSRDVLLVVDGSGSMQGEPFERVRRALAALVRGARPEDRLELVFFTGALGERVRFTEGAPDGGALDRAQRARALAQVERLVLPGGPTALLYSLEELVRERERVRREGIAILLSDGHDALGFDADARATVVVQRLAAARTRLSVFAIGDDADVEYLERFVAPGDELVRADPGQDWTSLFQREMYAEGVDCEAGRAHGVQDAAQAGLLAGGVPLGVFGPPLDCVARAHPAPGAEVVWRTTDGSPLAALQRVGLGLTASFASAPRADFSPAWGTDGGWFAPLVRVLARGAAQAGGRRVPSVSVRGEELVVTGLGPDTPARVAARLRRARTDALVDPADERVLAFELVPDDGAAVAAAPRVAALPDVARELGVDPGDALELVLTLPDRDALAGEAGGELVLGFAAPRAIEFRGRARRLAPERPLGRELTAAASARPAEEPPHPAAAPLLGLGLAALFAAGLGGFFGRSDGPRSRAYAARGGRAQAAGPGGQARGRSRR